MRALILALLFLAPAAAAERIIPRAVLPGLGAADPRRPVDGTAAPWRALGRVQRETGGTCTGTLIAPDLVLTAAHCLVSYRTGNLLQPGSIHFLLGYDRGRYAAHAQVARFVIGAGYDSRTRGPLTADWALLFLPGPIGTADRVLPLLAEPVAPGAPLLLGGYQQDRIETLLADPDCAAEGYRGGMLIHGCAGTRGSSGAPLLARGTDGRWGVVGVASSVELGSARGAAVPAAAIRPALADPNLR